MSSLPSLQTLVSLLKGTLHNQPHLHSDIHLQALTNTPPPPPYLHPKRKGYFNYFSLSDLLNFVRLRWFNGDTQKCQKNLLSSCSIHIINVSHVGWLVVAVQTSLHVGECLVIRWEKGVFARIVLERPRPEVWFCFDCIPGRKLMWVKKDVQLNHSKRRVVTLRQLQTAGTERDESLLRRQTRMYDRVGNRGQFTETHDMFLRPGSWTSEHFSCHRDTWEGHPVSGVNKTVIGQPVKITCRSQNTVCSQPGIFRTQIRRVQLSISLAHIYWFLLQHRCRWAMLWRDNEGEEQDLFSCWTGTSFTFEPVIKKKKNRTWNVSLDTEQPETPRVKKNKKQKTHPHNCLIHSRFHGSINLSL